MSRRRGRNEGSIFKRGDGRWVALLDLGWENGRRTRKAYYATTRAEAAAKLAAGIRARQQGLPIVGQRATLGAFLDRYLAEVARATLRPRTFESYRGIIEHHLKPALGHVPLVRLGPDTLQAFLNAQTARGLRANTVRNHHAVLRRALAQAERWALLPRNPARLVSRPRVAREEIRPLTPEEARRFLDAARGDRLEALIALALGTGARQGELLGLTWGALDLDGGAMHVRRTLQKYGGAFHLDEPKTRRSVRTIPLPAPLVAALRAHRARQLEERLRAGSEWSNTLDLVFTTERGNPILGSALYHRLQTLLRRAGLPPRSFHSLRHSAATFMLASGTSLRVAQEVLGHSTIAVTADIYGHVAEAAEREATERVGALLWAVLEPVAIS